MAERKPRTKSLGEWQGGPRPVDAVDDPDADHVGTADLDPIQTPVVVSVVLVCPRCQAAHATAAKLQTRMTRDQDGTGHLALRVRAPKVMHLCDQPTLGLVEGARER